MPWHRPEKIAVHNLNQIGLGDAMVGSQICKQAESLYPGLFEGVSYKNGVFHASVYRAKLLQFKLIEGPLTQALQTYCLEQKFKPLTRVRLTIADE